jgi:hypothetical protein
MREGFGTDDHCPHCGWPEELPSADPLGLRYCSLRVYEALQNGDIDSRQIARGGVAGWVSAATGMLKRLERRLAPYGFAIARIGILKGGQEPASAAPPTARRAAAPRADEPRRAPLGQPQAPLRTQDSPASTA